MTEINFFAKTNFRNKERVFGIKSDDRRRHMYVIGKTGMGKTNLIQNMAIQDIRNGKGVAIVDPHGEFAEECLRSVPSSRINDVIYFNPSDIDNPLALNVMEKVGPEYRHLVASGLVGVFKKIWADSWGPRLEYLLRNAILALLEYPSSTLLGVTRILVDKEYRDKVLEKVSDPVVKSFWTDEFSKYHDRLMADAIAPIQNKVGQFLSSALIRNIVGQTKSSFSVREVMDQEKILIMNLSKGRVGEDNSALLGAMMITKIQLAAMARVDTPEKERKDFYLYVDEFQNFATESFSNILSEARKYRLNLILAHQYIAQLEESVRDAVLGNVGTMAVFRIGAMDADVLEKEFEPTFTANDLVNLAKYNIYLKLMIDGVATSPFSANSLPPIDVTETQLNEDKIIRVSRERYGSTRDLVEEKITRWSGIMKPEIQNKVKELAKQQLTIQSQVNNRSNVSENKPEVTRYSNINAPAKGKAAEVTTADDRPSFDTECSACGLKIQVPFKPDGARPTFCKDCLKDYRRQQAKLQAESQPGETSPKSFSKAVAAPVDADLGGQSLKQALAKAVSGSKTGSKPTMPKAEVDKAGLRNMIQEALSQKEQ